MSKFDMIIGYPTVKKELKQIADTLKNREFYEKLGVKAPRGLLLHGEPGVGKTLMATALIEAGGRQAFVCRKDQPDGDFVKHIKETFLKAMDNAPSIVLLDDMDKFANGDEDHPDAEEYVTVQSCIDEAKNKEVFVLATVNNKQCLPESLCRAGRFDRVLRIGVPRGDDAVEIIHHYLKNKKVAEDIDVTTIARIMDYRSCAELETVVNTAGMFAGYSRSECITMDHLLEACLRNLFNAPPTTEDSDDAIREDRLEDPNYEGTQIVYHEAGHAVVSEILRPGSVTLAYVYNRTHNRGGFVDHYEEDTYTPLYRDMSEIATSLGGVAANEWKFGVRDIGGRQDLNQAFSRMHDLIVNRCICGLHLYSYGFRNANSEDLRARQEEAVVKEIERVYGKVKEILSRNSEFLDKLAHALARKKLLSAAEIRKIKDGCNIVSVAL